MGTLTAGIKEIFSSAKTTGSNVMLCGNDGTPDGHITMDNLANILGVNFTWGNEVDLDYPNVSEGFIVHGTNTPELVTHKPTDWNGQMLALTYIGIYGERGFQVLFGEDVIYYRVLTGTWETWKTY